jgi:hypothetical protein
VVVVFHGKRIRIQWTPGRALASQQNFALAASSLLAPCALVAFTLTCWNMAAGLRWTSGFIVSRGVFSHWQSWLLASSLLFLISRALTQCVSENDLKY